MSAEKLYEQVKSGKVKLEQLNDEGKAALKSFMTTKTQTQEATKKYGTNEQRAGSALARQRAEENQKSLVSARAKEAEAKSAQDKWDEEHGRNIPVIGSVLRGLDAVKETTKPFADVAQSLYTPGGGLTAINAGTKAVGALISRVAPKIGNGSGLLPRVATRAAEEAVTGVPLAVGNTLGRNPEASNKELGMNALLGGSGGALVGAAGPVVGAGFKSVLSKYMGRAKNPKVIENILALPAPRERGNANGAITPDVINVPETTPRGLPSPRGVTRTDSPKLDELVQSKGYEEVIPETIAQTYNGKTWYHGTGTDKLTAETLDPFAGSHESLFGQGVYLTDDPKIANGYAKSRGKRGAPTIYESQVNIDRVLDLEKPPSQDVTDAIVKTMKSLDYSYNYHFEEPDHFTNLVLNGVKKGETTEQIIQNIRKKVSDFSHEAELSTNEFVEDFQELAINLKQAGYDGLTHTGGHRTGNEAHRVLILLDPQNHHGIAEGARQVTRFAKYEKPIEDLSTKYGVLNNAAMPVERVGRAPLPRTEVVEGAPIRPRVDVTPSNAPVRLSDLKANQPKVNPVDDVEEILQSVQQPRVRDRVVSFLDEQEKAALARIAKRKNTLSANPFDEWGDHAIVMAAQLGKGTIKAADFTEALVRRFGESARPHAQTIYRKSKEILRTEERRASKEGQEAIAFNESGIGDASTFENKITRSSGIVGNLKRKINDFSFADKWERFKTQFTEDIAPVNKLERNVTGGIASAEKSFYKSARLFKGVPEKINQYIEQRLKPIMRQIEKAGHNSDELGRYALAMHAKDVNKSGIKSGFTNAEIDDVIRKLGNPELEAARQQLVALNKGLLDDLVDSGVVPAEMRDALNERWKNYIPLFRDVDDVVSQRSGLSEALANVASPIKRLKGSEKNVIDPIENMVENIIKNINAAERNKVASHISKLSKLDPDEKFIRKLKDGEGIEGKNVVSVKENGKNVYYEVEKDVRDAILTLDKESSTWLMRFLATPASWLRAGATLTPEFIIRNPLRDYRNAKIVSESGFRLDDYAVGLASSIMGKFGKGKLYQDWVQNLGAYGNIVSEDRKVFMAAQKKVLTQSTSQKMVNIVDPRNLIKILRGISDISESSTKVGEYRAALRKGATKEEAAFRSRDIMDFARAGTSIRQTNKIVAFLNANIQGKSKMVRAFKKHPVKTSVKVFTNMAVPTAGIYFYNKQFANDTQKETIKNAPDWQKNTFWLIAIPGTDMVGRFPKPFDFAVVANVVERSLDFFEGNDKEAFNGFAQGVVADNALPMMITGLQPLMEGAMNYSLFRQGPVIPQRDSGLKPEDQYDPVKTSGTARGIAKGVDKVFGEMGGNFRSPYIIDNTIQGLFAGGGKYATDAIDAILGATGATDKPKAPEKSVEQKPVLRSFMVDPNQGGKVMDKFYDTMDKLEKERNSNKRNDVTFGKEKKKDIYLPADKEKLRKSFDAASDDVSDINTEIRAIERDKLITPQQKRLKIDALIGKRKTIIERVVKN